MAEISRRSLLQAAAALSVSGSRAWAQGTKGIGPDEYYNKKGPVVQVAPGLDIGYREAWLGAPWEKPEPMLLIHGNIESAIVWYGWRVPVGPQSVLSTSSTRDKRCEVVTGVSAGHIVIRRISAGQRTGSDYLRRSVRA